MAFFMYELQCFPPTRIKLTNTPQTYFDHTRPRLCPGVQINLLALFAEHNRLHELQPSISWIHGILLHRAYLDGLRYYKSPDVFCFFLARALRRSPPLPDSPTLYKQLLPLLITRLAERHGLAGDALSLAMRVVACNWSGIPNEVDRERLEALQMEDGGWAAGAACCYGSSGLDVGNRGLTTALAVQALERMDMRAEAPTPAPEVPVVERRLQGRGERLISVVMATREYLFSYATSVLMATLVSLFLIMNV